MKRWTSTSSHSSCISLTRTCNARADFTTDRCSTPSEASSAAGLQIAGNPTAGSGSPARATAKRGTGSRAASSIVLTTCFRRQMDVVQLPLPVHGIPSSSSVEITGDSSAATPSMPSQRLKARSGLARRTRSTQRASGFTGTRTGSWPSPTSTASTASTVSRMARSGDLPSAEMPSKSTTTFIRNSGPRFRVLPNASIGGAFDSPPRWGASGDAQLDALPFRGVKQTCLNELVEAHPGGTRRFRKAGIVRGVGENPGKGIDLDHVGLARRIQSDVDPRPVTTAKHAVGAEHDLFDRTPQLLSDPRGTFEDLEWLLGAIPDPLRLEAIDGKRALGERFEVHADDGKHACVIAVAEHCTGELSAGEVLLDDDRLLVALEEKLDLRVELTLIFAVVRFCYSLGRSFVSWLNKKRESGIGNRESVGVGAVRFPIPICPLIAGARRFPNDREGRRRDAVVRENLFGARFIQAE